MRLVRPRLLQWQWSDYSAKHRDPTDLLLHIVAVPLFEIGTIVLLAGAAVGSGRAAVLGLTGMVAAVVVEGRGRRRGRRTPTPFPVASPSLDRFFLRQWLTVPRSLPPGPACAQ